MRSEAVYFFSLNDSLFVLCVFNSQKKPRLSLSCIDECWFWFVYYGWKDERCCYYVLSLSLSLLFFFEDISLVFNDWVCFFYFTSLQSQSYAPIFYSTKLFRSTAFRFNHFKPLKLSLSISWRLAIRSGSP